jgi:hypothetical protein
LPPRRCALRRDGVNAPWGGPAGVRRNAPNNPASLSVRPIPFRYAVLLRYRSSPDILIWAFATVLLTPVVAFAGMRLTLPSPGID